MSLRQDRRKVTFSATTSCFSPKPKEKEGGETDSYNSQNHAVILNVYNDPRSSNLNRYLYNLGLGRYFSTVVVHKSEYVYMKDTDGIRRSQLGTFANEKQLTLQKTIVIGYTDKDDEEVEKEISRLGMIVKYGESKEYHAIAKNSNHFSDEFCRVLTGKGIPKWVNRIKFTTFIGGFFKYPPPEPPLVEDDVTL